MGEQITVTNAALMIAGRMRSPFSRFGFPAWAVEGRSAPYLVV